MTVTVHLGDSRVVLATLPDCSVDSIVTDPPYELAFMGAKWDATGIAYDVDLWREVLRVLKPGGHLAAFGGTRTYHRLAVAIEDAGFEIRDQLAWTYGTGFPKSLDVSKAIDKAAGVDHLREFKCKNPADRPYTHTKGETSTGWQSPVRPDKTHAYSEAAKQWQGWGTALKPAWEPICLARKPITRTVASNVLEHGTGALNIDGCRIEAADVNDSEPYAYRGDNGVAMGAASERLRKSGGGAGSPLGRWPANIIHDGSDEVVAAFPEVGGGKFSQTGVRAMRDNPVYGKPNETRNSPDNYGDAGSAARFFYSAKAGKLDRLGSSHPTVKPVDLIRWLQRLITPPRGVTLDPFAGSGPAAVAALAEGFDAILIELREEAVADINRRIAHVTGNGRRTAEEVAALNTPEKIAKAGGSDLPLFGVAE